MHNLTDSLNEEQKLAVNTIDGPLLVLAGAGSGKTRVVTFRIVQLLEMGIEPSQILGVTFTNKAAGEMRERVQHLTHSRVLISTFHSLGVRILRESIDVLGYSRHFTIYDEEDSDKLLKSCLADLGVEGKGLESKNFKHLISGAKNNMEEPDDITFISSERNDQLEAHFVPVYRLYQQRLKEYNALDFDDLLFLTVRLFEEHPQVLENYQNRWKYLLVDEYQDTNEAQYRIVQLLVSKYRNICVVGDPDQSIYSWRGANINNIMNFSKDYPDALVIRLEQNYRSRSNILDAANEVIQYNRGRYEKNLWTDLGPGEKIKLYTAENSIDEAMFIASRIRFYHSQLGIPLREMAIFYRTNFQSRPFEDQFLSKRIPYLIVGGLSFYRRREIKDILAFLRVVQSETDFVSFMRTINIPKRGFGDTTLEKIRIGANDTRMPILKYCETLLAGTNQSLKLTAKQKIGLNDYIQIIYRLREINHTGTLQDLVHAAVVDSGYIGYIKEDKETYEDRKENLDSLISKAGEWEMSSEMPSLAAFLEELSLNSTLDEAGEFEDDRVSLMTIHNGKGLEFTVAFLVGMEEDLFPHINSKGNTTEVEEERRLCYVGMTRAKEFLYLSHARVRFLRGSEQYQLVSRFLKEVPPQYVERLRRLPI